MDAVIASVDWTEFSILRMPPDGFLLVYVKFDGPTNPKAPPRILIAYYTREGHWRTVNGRLEGQVTHYMPLPSPPRWKKDIEHGK